MFCMKSIKLFLLVCLLLLHGFFQKANAQTYCDAAITNFTSVCTQYGPPQIFNISFTVTTNYAADSVVLTSYQGVITGQPNPNVAKYKIVLNGNSANVSFTLTRNIALPTFYCAITGYKGGVQKCSQEKTPSMTSCPPPPPCASFNNFKTVCKRVTPTTQYQISFDASTVSGDSIVIAGYNGTINGANPLSYKIQLTNNTAMVSFLFTPTIVYPYIAFSYKVYKNGVVRCSNEFSMPLCSCTGVCLNTWMNYNIQVKTAFPSGILANFNAPSLYIFGGLSAGDAKVVKETATFSSTKRRYNCNGTVGPWQTTSISPLSAAQLSNPTGYNSNNNAFAYSYNTAFNNIPGHDFGANLAIPATKLIPSCSEDYQLTMKVCVIFEGGCTQCQTFSDLIITRP
jgi:hypothetical protein